MIKIHCKRNRFCFVYFWVCVCAKWKEYFSFKRSYKSNKNQQKDSRNKRNRHSEFYRLIKWIHAIEKDWNRQQWTESQLLKWNNVEEQCVTVKLAPHANTYTHTYTHTYPPTCMHTLPGAHVISDWIVE